MDWIIMIAVCAAAGAGALWYIHRLKKDVYTFADNLEKNLDNIITGKPMEEIASAEDSLWGKISEKLQRVEHIWKKRDEESLREKRKMKELISDISHQTKTPIANLKIYMELLQDEKMSENAKQFLRSMESQTEKLDFLIQSMIKMSRLETGIIQIHTRQENLFDTLGKAVAAVVPKAADKQIELFVTCPKELFVCHDPKWTEEALSNILDNGVKYTEAGGTIYVTVTSQEIFTKISIRDTGKGIAKERQAEIFTRFYREPEVHDQEGIGIGLYLAREIVKLQGGYIEVNSEPKKGADFTLFLPNEGDCR